MVNVQVFKSKDSVVKLISSGHADSAPYGQDIVCSAVSVYLINTVNTLTEILKLKDKIKFEFESGYFLIQIDYDLLSENEFIQVDILMKSLVLALESIENENKKHVRINYREV